MLCIILKVSIIHAQNLKINELMSANVNTLTDEDGEYADWIELYNSGSTTVDLTGFALSDDEQDTLKWVFPRVTLPADSFLLVFASGKDRRQIVNHWESVIQWGDIWYYHLGDASQPSNWYTPEFNEKSAAGWKTGSSGFGYGDNDDATVVSPVMSVFIKKRFNVIDTSTVITAVLDIDYDDAFVAYINGIEIARDNIGAAGIPPAFDLMANGAREAKLYGGGQPDRFYVDSIRTLLRPGENVMAIQVHNTGTNSSDLTCIPFFSLGMIQVPVPARGPSALLHLTKSHLHTNFKISAEGELILLTSANRNIIDEVQVDTIPADISFGRKPDGGNAWYYFTGPTPGKSNTAAGYQGICSEPAFSKPGGFYPSSVVLEIKAGSGGGSVYFTSDGSGPTPEDMKYTDPLSVNSNIRVLRARTYKDGYVPSKIVTNTYFINQQFQLPVVSLATDPGNFFDNDTGIYVYGPNADTVNYPYWGSNFWQDWERPLHIEFYEPDGQVGFSLDAGVKIFGGWSRLYPQKSLAIFARGKYGADEIPYKIFAEKNVSSFQSILLRNSGQDWGKTMFSDGLMSMLLLNTNSDIMAYRPALVYLNGQNWGIHNIREKMNEHYLASNHGVDPDNVDIIENDNIVVTGDRGQYEDLLNYIANNDLSDPGNYRYVTEIMDIDNFIELMVAGIYYVKTDWPGNNTKAWRSRTPGSRWRWLFYDSDYGFSIGHLDANSNMFDYLRTENCGLTRMFFKLLTNETFKIEFLNRFADFFNTRFSKVNLVSLINAFRARLEPEMPRHIEKWKGTFSGPWWLGKSIDSMEEWYASVQVLVNFANTREGYSVQHILNEFGLTQQTTVNLDVSLSEGGRIQINSIRPEIYPWTGKYFTTIPVKLRALPNRGYKFLGWTGYINTLSDTVTIPLTVNQISVTALFEKVDVEPYDVVINEINYNSAPDFDPEDWIEIYNNFDQPVNLSGWKIKDSEDAHIFEFPENTVLDSGDYLIICRDTLAFAALFPDVSRRAGNLPFGLGADRDMVRIFDVAGNLADSVFYGTIHPWPDAPDGEGPTLSLKDPSLDNTLPENWAASIDHGTPGSQNVSGTDEEDEPEGYYIKQNYPNPFNMKTTIEYHLDAPTQRLVLDIYNLLGQKIQSTVIENQVAGTHTFEWSGELPNGQSLPSGLYFYRVVSLINNQEVTITKKMILLR